MVQVNGSGIRAWWIRHHYWSIATCMLVLTLPVDSPKVQLFVKKWVWWSCWQVCLRNPFTSCHRHPSPETSSSSFHAESLDILDGLWLLNRACCAFALSKSIRTAVTSRSLLQGMMMILQNHYQRRRMYTRIALGKNRAMDVVSGESSGGSGQLVVLYPLLFGLQGFQCLIGTVMPQNLRLSKLYT